MEHEVSVITGLQVIENLDKEQFNPIPIYISKEGRFYSGEMLKDFKTYKEGKYREATEVFIIPQKGDRFLYSTKVVGGIFKKPIQKIIFMQELMQYFQPFTELLAKMELSKGFLNI